MLRLETAVKQGKRAVVEQTLWFDDSCVSPKVSCVPRTARRLLVVFDLVRSEFCFGCRWHQVCPGMKVWARRIRDQDHPLGERAARGTLPRTASPLLASQITRSPPVYTNTRSPTWQPSGGHCQLLSSLFHHESDRYSPLGRDPSCHGSVY